MQQIDQKMYRYVWLPVVSFTKLAHQVPSKGAAKQNN